MGLLLPSVFEAPLFPLPGVVLYPGMMLPLHIFEPRYRRMLADALAGEKMIAMGHLRSANGTGPAEPSEVYEILGVGRIAAHEELADGTSNIALVGLARCRLRREPQAQPYRIATLSPLKDFPLKGAALQKRAQAVREALRSAADTLMRRTIKLEAREVLYKSLEERTELGSSSDFLAGLFIRDPAQRQRLLENLDPLERGEEVRQTLERFAAGLEPEPPPVTGRLDEFSTN